MMNHGFIYNKDLGLFRNPHGQYFRLQRDGNGIKGLHPVHYVMRKPKLERKTYLSRKSKLPSLLRKLNLSEL